MNEGTGMKDDMDEAAGMDAQGAAVIMRAARERARRELRVRRPVLFVTWGLVVLVSYGAMWLSVRGQRPYHGPAWETLLLAFLLFVAAAGATANVVDRAASGVGGWSELQRGIFALALLAGFAALEIEKQALSHAGASRPLVALFGEAVPVLVTGLVLVASSAVTTRLDWPRLAVGQLAAGRGVRRRMGGPGEQPGGVRAGGRRRDPADGSRRALAAALMSQDGLDPVIHVPARLRIIVTLAALPGGDDLSFTRLQDLIGLTPGNLITHLRKLEDAGYVTTQKNGSGVTARTAVALTHSGRAALDRYSTVLRELLDSAAPR